MIIANGNVYYPGAVEFNGSMANGTVSITADNNVTPNKQCSNEIHCA